MSVGPQSTESRWPELARQEDTAAGGPAASTEIIPPVPPGPIGPGGERANRAWLWAVLAILALMLVVGLAALAIAVVGGDTLSSDDGVEADAGDPDALAESADTVPVAPSESTASTEATDGPVPAPADEASTTTSPTSTPTQSSTVETTAPPATGGQAAPCSASGLSPRPDQPELPAAVAETRAAILSAALGCDLDGLSAIGGSDFTASFGGGDPTMLWANLESSGERPMWYLAQLLGLPHGTIEIEDTTHYVWPAAYAVVESWEAVSAADRADLETIYSAEEMASFDELSGYYGYRIGIDENGDWIFFVAGD